MQQMAEVTREGFRLKKILIEDWKKAREEKQVRGPGADQDLGGLASPYEWCPRASSWLALACSLCSRS